MLRWIARILGGIVLLLLLGVGYLWWTNRDLPVEVVEAKYGGQGLQQANIHGVPVRYKVEGEGPPPEDAEPQRRCAVGAPRGLARL